MMDKLVIVTDLGSFKAYRWEENELNSGPRLELLEEFETVAGHERLGEMTSDQGGRFPKARKTNGVMGDMGSGERHNIELEQRRRLVKQVADSLNKLLSNNGFEICYFAAGSEINKHILEALNEPVRNKIAKNLACNLTKADKKDLIKHFSAQ